MTSRTTTALATHLTNLKPILDRLVRGVQLSRFCHRSDSDRQAIQPAATIARWSGFAPRRWRSGAWRASSSRSSACSRSWETGRPSTFDNSIPSAHGPAFAAFVHRWTRGADLVALVWILRQMFDRAGSIEGFLAEGYDPAATDVGPALDSFSTRALALDIRAAYGRVPRAAGRLLFLPASVSRQRLQAAEPLPSLDGPARRARPRRLVPDRDRVARRPARYARDSRGTLPSASRATPVPAGRMAHEITSSLRQLDPDDPVKYDFALCHLGMMNACGFNRAQRDSQCPLRGVCRPRVHRRLRLRRPSVPR